MLITKNLADLPNPRLLVTRKPVKDMKDHKTDGSGRHYHLMVCQDLESRIFLVNLPGIFLIGRAALLKADFAFLGSPDSWL